MGAPARRDRTIPNPIRCILRVSTRLNGSTQDWHVPAGRGPLLPFHLDLAFEGIPYPVFNLWHLLCPHLTAGAAAFKRRIPSALDSALLQAAHKQDRPPSSSLQLLVRVGSCTGRVYIEVLRETSFELQLSIYSLVLRLYKFTYSGDTIVSQLLSSSSCPLYYPTSKET